MTRFAARYVCMYMLTVCAGVSCVRLVFTRLLRRRRLLLGTSVWYLEGMYAVRPTVLTAVAGLATIATYGNDTILVMLGRPNVRGPQSFHVP
jgi:hypothetical protein